MGLLAIDPGKDTGWAWFLEGRLINAGVVDGDEPRGYPAPLGPGDEVIAEKPCYRRSGSGRKSTPDDLVTLGMRLGLVLGTLGFAHVPTRLVLPGEWKGQLPKAVCENRIRQALQRTELDAAHAAAARLGAKGHNLWDAVGLGLYQLRRFG
jgi:hypothetical protein